MSEVAYYGRGMIYMRESGAAAALRYIGNVTGLRLNITEQVDELPDRTTGAGGTYAEVRYIQSIGAELDLAALEPKNVAIAVLGASSAVAGASATDEPGVGYVGGLIKLAHPGPYTSVVVTGTGGTPTYVAGDDYEVRSGGIFIPTGSSITDGTNLLIDYTYPAYDKVQAAIAGSKDYEVVCDLINVANSDKPRRVHLFKLRLGPAAQQELIGENFSQMTLAGTVVKDTSKSGAGVSQYYTDEIVA